MKAARCFAGFAVGGERTGTADLSIWKATSIEAEPKLVWSIETDADLGFHHLVHQEARAAMETIGRTAPLN